MSLTLESAQAALDAQPFSVQGEAIVARARVVHAGRTQAVCQCEVFAVEADREVLCAVAQGTIAALGSPK